MNEQGRQTGSFGDELTNAAMIGLASAFFDGFTVSGFWPAIGAAVVTGVVSWIAGAFIRD